MAHPDLIRQILPRQPERRQQELHAAAEHAETLGSDRVCALSGHAFVLVVGRFVCAACGAGVAEGL
jgi:hypothetical protein